MTIFQQMLLCACGPGLASLFGSTIGLAVKKIPHRWNDIFLGFCAGMMLTASLVCLIVPVVEMAGGRRIISPTPFQVRHVSCPASHRTSLSGE